MRICNATCELGDERSVEGQDVGSLSQAGRVDPG